MNRMFTVQFTEGKLFYCFLQHFVVMNLNMSHTDKSCHGYGYHGYGQLIICF